MGVPDAIPFFHPGDLKHLSPQYLARLLTPYAGFLESRGLSIPRPGIEASSLDCSALADILMRSGPDTPRGLIDSLQCVREMATPEAMDYLLREAGIHGIHVDDPELSPADLAVRMLLCDRSILEHVYAEQFLVRPCAFVYFQEEHHTAEFRGLSPNIVRALEGDLEQWFRKTKRGRDCRVYVYPRRDGIWFLIWHGAPYRREGCIVHGTSSCVCYRPERYDVVVYQPATGELQIEADAVEEREVYRRYFGRHFFGDDHHFPGTAVYTLEPLRTDGERALVCADVEGMELVTLYRVEFIVAGRFRTMETIEAQDVFAAIDAGEARGIPHNARLRAGGFRIRFSGSRIPRKVALRPSNMVYYERDSDCVVVEPWLRLRGFMSSGHLLVFLLIGLVFRFWQDIDAVLSCLPDWTG